MEAGKKTHDQEYHEPVSIDGFEDGGSFGFLFPSRRSPHVDEKVREQERSVESGDPNHVREICLTRQILRQRYPCPEK